MKSFYQLIHEGTPEPYLLQCVQETIKHPDILKVISYAEIGQMPEQSLELGRRAIEDLYRTQKISEKEIKRKSHIIDEIICTFGFRHYEKKFPFGVFNVDNVCISQKDGLVFKMYAAE